MREKPLKIGNKQAKIPLIQGGMGVGVSLSKLAGAVAANGGIGIISTAQIGYREDDFDLHPIEANLRAIGQEIKAARAIADGGIIGVNIMVATREYDRYVEAALSQGADLIISGAGLPMTLPKLAKGYDTKLVPIVSSRKSADVICKYWKKKYDRLPDAVVIEGPLAGGHLGFSLEELQTYTKPCLPQNHDSYDDVVREIIKCVKEYAKADDVEIPVIVAGGIYRREDMLHYLDMGAAGVQMATRFVTTIECDASPAFKQTYIDAKQEDIVLVKSPVGMPGRAIRNSFLDRAEKGQLAHGRCHLCISTCKQDETPYCITEALINAVEGNTENGLLFCGSNAYLADHLETVKEIMEEFQI